MQNIYLNSQNIVLEKPVTASIGFFDGVHRGHRFLLQEIKKIAEQTDTYSAVITFRNHPGKFINPDMQLNLLSTFEEKMELLADEKLDYCFVLDFNEEIKNLTAGQFITDIIKTRLNASYLLIGYDHKFGKDRDCGFEDYVRIGSELGIEVIKEPDYSPLGEHISSSEVRRSLAKGDVNKAAGLLSYNYHIKGKVVTGHQIGRTIGFPTANIETLDFEKMIPSEGVYVVNTLIDGNLFYGILNIGNRPTIHKHGEKTIEVHLFDFKDNIYDKTLTVNFLHFLRGEKKMNSLEELKDQISKDKSQAIKLIYNI